MAAGENDLDKGAKGAFDQTRPTYYMDFTKPPPQRDWLGTWHYAIPGAEVGAESRVLCLRMGTCETADHGAFAVSERKEDVNCQQCLEWLHA